MQDRIMLFLERNLIPQKIRSRASDLIFNPTQNLISYFNYQMGVCAAKPKVGKTLVLLPWKISIIGKYALGSM